MLPAALRLLPQALQGRQVQPEGLLISPLAVLWVYLGSERPLSEAHTHYLSCISEQMPSLKRHDKGGVTYKVVKHLHSSCKHCIH